MKLSLKFQVLLQQCCLVYGDFLIISHYSFSHSYVAEIMSNHINPFYQIRNQTHLLLIIGGGSDKITCMSQMGSYCVFATSSSHC